MVESQSRDYQVFHDLIWANFIFQNPRTILQLIIRTFAVGSMEIQSRWTDLYHYLSDYHWWMLSSPNVLIHQTCIPRFRNDKRLGAKLYRLTSAELHRDVSRFWCWLWRHYNTRRLFERSIFLKKKKTDYKGSMLFCHSVYGTRISTSKHLFWFLLVWKRPFRVCRFWKPLSLYKHKRGLPEFISGSISLLLWKWLMERIRLLKFLYANKTKVINQKWMQLLKELKEWWRIRNFSYYESPCLQSSSDIRI
jgi:hypothetical protein